MVAKIHKSSERDPILGTTIANLRRAMGADRVVIYHFHPNSELAVGEIVCEDVLPSFSSAFSLQIRDTCFHQTYINQSRRGGRTLYT